jgi:hypothetical protein
MGGKLGGLSLCSGGKEGRPGRYAAKQGETERKSADNGAKHPAKRDGVCPRNAGDNPPTYWGQTPPR